jgi:poly-gamma-glutamate capsule biosynthesis protein CapA/YwtB (metallophosphatase superfamily)
LKSSTLKRWALAALLAEPALLPALTVSAVGDIVLWNGPMEGELRKLEAAARRPWEPSVYPFERVEPYLKGMVFGNLEAPLTARPPQRFKPAWMRYYFKSPMAESVDALKQGGFRVLSLANNHAMDSGARGLRDTLAALAEGEIHAVGAGMNADLARQAAVVNSSQGGRVRFLAYNFIGPPGTFARAKRAGAARAQGPQILKDVRREAAHGDPVIVSLHWGIERKADLPVAEPLAWQRELARAIIDAGAVAIFGHHTHAVGRFEEYGRGLIAYSLGNFLFSASRYDQRRRSVILRCELDAQGVHAWDLVPVHIDSPQRPFQPTPMRKAEGSAYLARVLGGRSFARYGPRSAEAVHAAAGSQPDSYID